MFLKPPEMVLRHVESKVLKIQFGWPVKNISNIVDRFLVTCLGAQLVATCTKREQFFFNPFFCFFFFFFKAYTFQRPNYKNNPILKSEYHMMTNLYEDRFFARVDEKRALVNRGIVKLVFTRTKKIHTVYITCCERPVKVGKYYKQRRIT